jgi:xylan 1,4-beta-xylosidase
MSYWVFTDIFEEAGPRFTPFHGGFGLLNYEGIKKPAFYAFAYLNKLGETELVNPDPESWASKNNKGGVQVLLWDFSNTLPDDSINNQAYYIRDLPSNPKGKVKIEISGIPAGKYQMEIYKVGYRVNDAFSTYLSLNKPAQLTREQVDNIKKQNDGTPVLKEVIIIKSKDSFIREYEIRENDVIMVDLTRL